MYREQTFWRATAGLVLTAILVLLALSFWRLNTPPPPDPRLIDVSVRSTLFALPTQTARVVIATQIVEVTRVVSVTVIATATPAPTATTASQSLQQGAAQALSAPQEAAVALQGVVEEAVQRADAVPEAAASSPVDQAPASPPACPLSSTRVYDTIPVDSHPADHPDSIHGDLNLRLRGWSPVQAELGIVNIDGPTDGDPPQLATIFSDSRLPAFTSAYQVYDWNWGCSAHGCRGELMTHREVLLLGMGTSSGETLSIPNRGAQIYGGGYKALVLYAEANRITLVYTREDSVANGYAIHLENLCVDPNLLLAYQTANAAGRGALPALRDDEVLGTATGEEIRVAVRDRGAFLDPRARKDWWRGF